MTCCPPDKGKNPVLEETATNWLTREFGMHPNAIRGFRFIHGDRLEDAKSKSDDNTGLLRWLYIPVSHARRMCVLGLFDRCGQLYVNGRWTPNEHIDRIDMKSVIAVVAVGWQSSTPKVYLFTREFDWKRHWN